MRRAIKTESECLRELRTQQNGDCHRKKLIKFSKCGHVLGGKKQLTV